MRKLTYYVATTLDGYIADPTGKFDMFPMEGDHIDAIVKEYTDTLPAPALAALGLVAPRSRFNAVVMGWRTYEVGFAQGVVNPYPHLTQIVFSKSHQSRHPEVTVTADDPIETVRRLKAQEGSGIWLCGGGALAATLEAEIDELVLKVNPLVLGDGIRLFARPSRATPWRLESARTFQSGVAIMTYRQPNARS